MTGSGLLELSKIAMRNLARHRLKTILTVAAIMVSVAVFIVIKSMLGGMSIESHRSMVNYEAGAAKLQTKLYFEKKDEIPSYEVFPDWEIYSKALESEGYLSAPRFVFSGTLFSTSLSAPILFHAVEPDAEREVMRYVPYVVFGRYVQNGSMEIALGTIAAEKLKVGIPKKPQMRELEDLIDLLALSSDTWSAADRDFILSLYKTDYDRMLLKNDSSRADLDRYWDMIARTDRNDVRINAVIDIKAVPDTIRPDKWEGELMPILRPEDRTLVEAAYQYENFMDAYLLYEEDAEQLEKILTAMIRAGYGGAVRHVNQLVDAVVVGVIDSPNPLPNGYTAYIPLDVLQDEAGMMLSGAVTELVIKDKNRTDAQLPGKNESAEAITAALERGLASLGLILPSELAVRTWPDYMEDFLNTEAIESAGQMLLAFLLFFLSFLGISNTILLAILERTKEIGMMRAMGMSDKQMILVYMLEAGFLGLIGSIFGVILGCILNYFLVEYGIDLGTMGESESDFMYRTTQVIRSVWNIYVIIGTAVVATLLASLMAFIPTRRAVKMPITDSLRFD